MNKESNDSKKDEFLPDEEEFLTYLDSEKEEDEISEEDKIFQMIAYNINVGIVLHKKLLKKFKEIDDRAIERTNLNKIMFEGKVRRLIAKIGKCSDEVNNLLKKAFEFSEVSNRLWHHCSLTTYKKHLGVLKDTYSNQFKSATDLDFLKHEYFHLIQNTKKNKYNSPNGIHISQDSLDYVKLVDYSKIINPKTIEFFSINNQRKLDFLSNEILNLGYIIQLAQTKKDVFINLIPKPETINDFDKLDEIVLTKSQLPEFNLLERYETLKRLGYIEKIHKVTEIKKTKNMLLALTMNCSVDNARKLLDSTYKILDREKNKARQDKIEEEVDGFFRRNDVNV